MKADDDAPDFDAAVESAMAEETMFKPSDVDPDYAEMDDSWSPEA